MKSKQYLYNIFHIHSSQFLILMAQKSEEIMPDPDAIIRLRRDRLLGANLTGCDVKFCWMILIRKFEDSSPPPLWRHNQTKISRIHGLLISVTYGAPRENAKLRQHYHYQTDIYFSSFFSFFFFLIVCLIFPYSYCCIIALLIIIIIIIIITLI